MSNENRPWEGRVAFITGAVTGIGLGIAQAFADAGMRLALSYRNEADRAQTAQWFAAQGYEEPLFCKLDVTDRDRFAEVAAQVKDHFGEVHVLVNNAGVSVFGPTDEATYDDFDWIMGVNFGGVVNGIVSFLPAIKQSTGRRHVVNIASMAAFLPGPQAGIYTASKFAVRGLTESLRFNLAPHGIGCSLCCPALTRTNAWTSALKRPDDFGESGFGETDKTELEQFGTAFEAGMDPREVGEKVLRGMGEQRGLILTHPEHGPDFKEIYDASMAALPDEEAPADRLKIEELRREAMRKAEAGILMKMDDLT
ncbi:SDR family NAD(P)-dependent oxidoreductase [Altericroceibacterium endophyticum]|uniref:SDR family NAD(P)-dependent oxidoreductase n=1 Tax=Altericroceibacterium endophyticum TaxID=1808508 RepID=A0A6I4T5V4_9SPHN|nr:SDR family oxidoreductase [Altericroceibacterium endophyticum]MXO65383.1 SDR family NAD(P)-dependent oxidoreductase [Altericroceibacterium endophyticum]